MVKRRRKLPRAKKTDRRFSLLSFFVFSLYFLPTLHYLNACNRLPCQRNTCKTFPFTRVSRVIFTKQSYTISLLKPLWNGFKLGGVSKWLGFLRRKTTIRQDQIMLWISFFFNRSSIQQFPVSPKIIVIFNVDIAEVTRLLILMCQP